MLLLFESAWRDVRYAIRGLARSPGFTAAAVLTLALGLGANTAFFSVVYGVLFRPLPFPDPDRLVLLDGRREFNGRPIPTNYSLADLEQWSQFPNVFESIAMAGFDVVALEHDGSGSRLNARMNLVTTGFFSTLGMRVVLGRALGPGDDLSPVAVISQRLWRSQFGGSPDVLGRAIRLSGKLHTVVGVVEQAVVPDVRTDIWLPAGFAATENPMLAWPGARGFRVFARLKRGATAAQAQAAADAASRAFAQRTPEQYEHVTNVVRGLRDTVSGDSRPLLLNLFAAVGLVLIVACINVASLLVARNASRTRDFAIRAALGASRGTLVRIALAESVLISLAGAVAGGLMARWAIDARTWLEPAGLPRLNDVHVDGPVLLFTAIVAVAAAIASAVVPALQSPSILETQKAGGSTVSAHPRARRIRAVLVVAELAVSMVLLVGAGLLGRSLVFALRNDIGIKTDGAGAALVDLSFGRTLSDTARDQLVDRLVTTLQAQPGVEFAGVGASLPPNLPRLRVSFNFPDAAGQPREHMVDSVSATPGFFQALSVPLLRGRRFTSTDTADGQRVMFLDQRTARRFFGDRDPVGLTLPLGESDDPRVRPPVTVVGVVGDIKYAGLDADAAGAVYRPFTQQPVPAIFLVARMQSESLDPSAAIRQAIAAVDPGVTVYMNPQPLENVISDAARRPWFRTRLMVAIALIAVMLAASGLSGVVAYSVSQRTTEFGIRIALGANSSRVAAMVLKEGLSLAVVGIAIGLLGAWATTRSLSTFLYGVSAGDPISYVLAAAGLLVVTIAASYLPARAATHVDPIRVLRRE